MRLRQRVLNSRPNPKVSLQNSAKLLQMMNAAGKLIKTLDKGIYDEDWREFILLFVIGLGQLQTVGKQLDAAVQRLELSLPY